MVKETTGKRLTGAAALGPGPGRPAGVPNKATTAFREAVRQLLEGADLAGWLDQVAANDPGRALEIVAKLAEFASPKLRATELTTDAPLMGVSIAHLSDRQLEMIAAGAPSLDEFAAIAKQVANEV